MPGSATLLLQLTPNERGQIVAKPLSCASCRFYAPPRDSDTVYDRASETRDDVPDAHGRCTRIIHGNGGESPIEQSAAAYNAEPALVTDGSGYAASLRVLPSFGCVLHEAKDAG